MGLILCSCANRKRTAPCKQCPHYSNGYIYPLDDVELDDEFLEELRLNLIQTGVIVKDSVNEK